VEAGGGPGPRGGQGDAPAGQEGGEGQEGYRGLGLPLLRGEGPQGQVRPGRQRGRALSPAREAARGHVLGRR
jgi:hypothetical protein